MGTDTIRAYKSGKLDIGDFSMAANALNAYTASAGSIASFQSNGAANNNALVSINMGNSVIGNVTSLIAEGSTSGNHSIVNNGNLGTSDFMTITTAGNVGIGQTAPQFPLSIRHRRARSCYRARRFRVNICSRLLCIPSPYCVEPPSS
jgi:hypothetical protein